MDYSIRTIAGFKELDSIKSAWQNLTSEQNDPSMIDNDLEYLKFQVAEGVLDGDPLVCVLYADQQPVLIVSGKINEINISPSIAYFKLHFIRMKKKCYYVFPYAIFGETQSDENVRSLIKSIVPLLKKNNVDYVFFSLVPGKSRITKYLLKISNPLMKDRVPTYEDHYVLQTPPDLETFLTTRNTNSRQKFRRLIRRIEKDFPDNLVFKVYTSADDLEFFIENAELISQNCQLRALNVGFRATDNEIIKKKWLASKGYFRGYMLFINSKPVSFILGINYKRNFYLEYTGLTLEYEKYQLGTYLYLKMIEDISKNGVADSIDFTHGSDLYKKILSSINLEDVRIRLYIPRFSNLLFILIISFNSLINKFGRFILKKTGYYSKVRKHIRDRFKRKYRPNS